MPCNNNKNSPLDAPFLLVLSITTVYVQAFGTSTQQDTFGEEEHLAVGRVLILSCGNAVLAGLGAHHGDAG